MTDTPYVMRRATVEDLPQLTALWLLEQLPAAELEKQFTEFQVVSDHAGLVLATLAIRIAGPQGLLHSEAIARAELSAELRELLWKRLQIIIQNHALERLWTQLDSNYWREKGFVRAEAEQSATMPPAFAADGRPFQTLTLRAATANATYEREFAEIRAMQQEEIARLQRRVQWMKRFALGVTVVVFLLVIAFAIMLFRFGPRMFHRG